MFRNYYKNYAAPNPNYRYQPEQQQYADRKQRQPQQHIQQQLMDPLLEKVETDTSAAFSVTQLVNTTQRKNAKKPSSAGAKPRAKAEDRKEKEEKKGGKGGSRRSRSGNRSNYSAESLLNAQVQVPLETKDDKYRGINSPSKNSSPKVSNYLEKITQSSASTTRSNTTWSNEMNQHFGSLPFASLSPSPGLFSADISSFELGIFNPQVNIFNIMKYVHSLTDGGKGVDMFHYTKPTLYKTEKRRYFIC